MAHRSNPIDEEAQALAAACLAYRLRMLHRVVTGIYDDALRDHGLEIRVGQMNILTLLVNTGPITPGDVCKKMKLDASTVSRNVDRLIARGWVRAETCHDERSHRLIITPRGARTLHKAFAAWHQAQSQTEALLGRDGAAAIRRLADKIMKRKGAKDTKRENQ